MTLIKWTPQKSVMNFFDSVLNDTFTYDDKWAGESFSYIPFMNVDENDANYNVYLDLPGVSKKNVEVNVQDGEVTVFGKRSHSKRNENTQSILKELSYGTFKRSFCFSKEIQEDKVKACFKDGILTLTVPKAKEVRSDIKKISIS